MGSGHGVGGLVCAPLTPTPELWDKPPSQGAVGALTWMTQGRGPGQRQFLAWADFAQGGWGCSELRPSLPPCCVTPSLGSGLGGRARGLGLLGSCLGGPSWPSNLARGQSPVCAQPWQGALTTWAVTTAAALTAARAWMRGSRARGSRWALGAGACRGQPGLASPAQGGQGGGGGASALPASLAGCRKS